MTQSNAIRRAPAIEILLAFLKLGCLSFGGPVAHLGYFRAELVERRKWCSEPAYAELIALAQSLPGPASSQVAFALGLLRGGIPGALAAFAGFMMPSALLMTGFAFAHAHLSGPLFAAMLHGLGIVAAAVVAQAILAMRASLAPDPSRLLIAAVATAIAFLAPAGYGTLVTIAFGALAGTLLRLGSELDPLRATPTPLPSIVAWSAGALFLVLLALCTLPASKQTLVVFQTFFRTGALVFGGGHVVLPLLERAVVAPGWLDQSTFLAGYGAAQALPGPLFAFAAFLGASLYPATHPFALATTALLAIFLPGLLLMIAILPVWNRLRSHPRLRAAIAGINASVLGLLVAALLRPVLPTAIHSVGDASLALAALLLLIRLRWRWQPIGVVALVVLLSAACHAL